MLTQTIQHTFHSYHQCQDHHSQQDQVPLQGGRPSWCLLLLEICYNGQIHLVRRQPQRALEGLAYVLPLVFHPAADIVPPVRERLFLPSGQLRQVSFSPGPVDDPGGVNAAEAAAGVALDERGVHSLDAIWKHGLKVGTFTLPQPDRSLDAIQMSPPCTVSALVL